MKNQADIVIDENNRVLAQAAAVRLAQNWIASFVRQGRSLSEELIEERRHSMLLIQKNYFFR